MQNYYKSIKLLAKRLLLLVVVYQISRIVFYIFNQNFFDSVGFKEFFLGLRFDLSAIIFINLIFIVALAVPGKFKYKSKYQKIIKYAFFAVNIIFIATNFIDAKYFQFTSRRSSYSLITAKGMEHEMKKLAFLYLVENWKLTISFILIAIGFYKLIPSEKFKTTSKETSKKYLKQFIIFTFLIGLSLVLARGGMQRKVLNRVDAVAYTETENAPLVLNTPFCILKTINKDDRLNTVKYFDEKELYKIYNPIKKPIDTLPFIKKNIVIIILESFGNEHIGYQNNGKGFTPFLDSLITKSTFYKHAFANGKLSIDAMPSLTSSIPRLMDKAFIQSSYAFNKTQGMPKLLKDFGYHTAFFHGAFNGSQNFDHYANIVGFDEYYGKNEYPYKGGDDGYWGIFDEEFLHFFAEKITEFKEPFFTTVFTLSSHNPYTIPKKYKEKFPKGNNKISESIGYADYSLKKFFEFAKTQSWYKNTIFVITADHTSSEGKGWYKSKIGKFSIPILFFEPENEPENNESDLIFQQIDVMPTLFEKLNYPIKYFAFGNRLSDTNRFAISYLNNVYHFVTPNYFILFDGEKVLGVYDWKEDKKLLNNLKDTSDYKKELNLLKAIIQTYNNKMNKDEICIPVT
jgi:phosphoglycerol transferase MdoB-like AlkP superfamily enzyme